jgi:hypothetical protein
VIIALQNRTRKSLIHVKRPLVRIQPGALPQLQFPDLRILLHLQRNLLTEDLYFGRWITCSCALGFQYANRFWWFIKLSHTKRRQPLMPQHLILRNVGADLLFVYDTLLFCQLFQNRKGPSLSFFFLRVIALKFLLMALKNPWRGNYS